MSTAMPTVPSLWMEASTTSRVILPKWYKVLSARLQGWRRCRKSCVLCNECLENAVAPCGTFAIFCRSKEPIFWRQHENERSLTFSEVLLQNAQLIQLQQQMTFNTRLLKLNQDIRLRILSTSCSIFDLGFAGCVFQRCQASPYDPIWPNTNMTVSEASRYIMIHCRSQSRIQDSNMSPTKKQVSLLDNPSLWRLPPDNFNIPQLQRNPKKTSKPAGAACVSINSVACSHLQALTNESVKLWLGLNMLYHFVLLHQIEIGMFLTLGMPADDEST